MFFNTFVLLDFNIMKKTLSIIFIFTVILSLPSCFLFKPVQKTCPAYSINPTENETIELTHTKDLQFKNEKSL